MSGVLADCASLLGAVREGAAEHLRRHGPGAASSSFWGEPRRAARAFADRCQRRAFGGGLRPFGSAFAVCGLAWRDRAAPNGAEDEEGGGGPFEAVEAWQTDPSGALQYLDPEICPVHVVGTALGPGAASSASSASLLRRLRRFREATPGVAMPGGASPDSSVPLCQVILSIHEILLEEWSHPHPSPAARDGEGPSLLPTRDDGPAPDDAEGQEDDDEEEDVSMEVEVAVVSPETGAYKLSPDQVRRLLLLGPQAAG
jgi:hypothetical protein